MILVIRLYWEGGKAEERPFVWVKRTYRRGRFTPPKNGKSRKVDMSPQLKTSLQEHLTREKKKGPQSGMGRSPGVGVSQRGQGY